jgi:hypothetical protein
MKGFDEGFTRAAHTNLVPIERPIKEFGSLFLDDTASRGM